MGSGVQHAKVVMENGKGRVRRLGNSFWLYVHTNNNKVSYDGQATYSGICQIRFPIGEREGTKKDC
jgi:hypothetical protein